MTANMNMKFKGTDSEIHRAGGRLSDLLDSVPQDSWARNYALQIAGDGGLALGRLRSWDFVQLHVFSRALCERLYALYRDRTDWPDGIHVLLETLIDVANLTEAVG